MGPQLDSRHSLLCGAAAPTRLETETRPPQPRTLPLVQPAPAVGARPAQAPDRLPEESPRSEDTGGAAVAQGAADAALTAALRGFLAHRDDPDWSATLIVPSRNEAARAHRAILAASPDLTYTALRGWQTPAGAALRVILVAAQARP